MKLTRHILLSRIFAAALVAVAPSSQAQTGTPGSPSATTTIDGKQLPPPDPKFGGVIKQKATDSKPWWNPRVVPPKGAPNVLLIMTDDCGFGAPSTFGGVIPTPALDRIAKAGLRYTNFHSTSLCSPTRAALITGRNHHSAGYGVVGEAATGFTGYDSVIRKECGTIGRILRDNGYATSWFGKNHNTPFYLASQAGPFDQWPIGMGFEYFYGFMGGDTSQWEPYLFQSTTPIFPFQGNPGWNLTTAMADEAIQHMKSLKEIAPEKPFFVYYVPGGTHSPHHPTKEWIKKISALKLFDEGYNKLRTVQNGIMSGLDWFPTLCAAAGNTEITQQLLKGVKLGDREYKNHLDGYNQLAMLTSDAPSARHELFYFSGPALGAVRLDNVKFQFLQQPVGWRGPKVTTDMPILTNLRQDPFERFPMVGGESTLTGAWGYGLDFFAREFWRFVVVQEAVAKLAMTAVDYPPMQDPASFNLDAVKKRIDAMIREKHGQ